MSSKYQFHSVEEFDCKMDRMLKLSANIAKTNGIPPREPVIHMDNRVMNDYLEDLELQISHTSLNGPEAQLLRSEMENGLRMVHHGIHLYHAMTDLREHPSQFQKTSWTLFQDLDEIQKIHYRLWMRRNRQGGYRRSAEQMNHLLNFYYKSSHS